MNRFREISYTSISSARIVGYEHDAIRVGGGRHNTQLGFEEGELFHRHGRIHGRFTTIGIRRDINPPGYSLTDGLSSRL